MQITDINEMGFSEFLIQHIIWYILGLQVFFMAKNCSSSTSLNSFQAHTKVLKHCRDLLITLQLPFLNHWEMFSNGINYPVPNATNS